MKNTINIYLINVISIALILGCDHGSNQIPDETGENHSSESNHSTEGIQEIHLSELKYQSLGMETDTIPFRQLSGVVYANGQLEVPPQHEASVTPVLGGNVTSIEVIEGDQVRKGQPLAYIRHLDFTKLQAEYMEVYSQLEFLEQEYERQETLYEANVGAGKNFQKIQSELRTLQVRIKGYEAQLRQLNLNPQKIRRGNIYNQIPILSPIDGFIEKVLVKMGQYIPPQSSMFLVMNTDHIHADLMVFEKDVSKVRKGQIVTFTVESVPGEELTAEIFSVGRRFEENPKAVHIHAEIKGKNEDLIPGMYINGKIHTNSHSVNALPDEAIIEEDGKPFIFVARRTEENGIAEWHFTKTEIRTGMKADGWVEIKILNSLPPGTKVAWNNAYYLISEMNKSETSHSH